MRNASYSLSLIRIALRALNLPALPPVEGSASDCLMLDVVMVTVALYGYGIVNSSVPYTGVFYAYRRYRLRVQFNSLSFL